MRNIIYGINVMLDVIFTMLLMYVVCQELQDLLNKIDKRQKQCNLNLNYDCLSFLDPTQVKPTFNFETHSPSHTYIK